jgi:SulP family sulfate permease
MLISADIQLAPSTAQLALVPEVEDSAIDTFTQPLPLLLQTFGSYESDAAVPDIQSIEFLHKLAPYFTQVVASHGTVLWNQRDQADGLYLIESGSLRATYLYDDHRTLIQETMVAGTIAGDLSTLSATSRNATVVAEGYCVLWKLETAKLQQMEEKDSATARRFIKIVLKGEYRERSRTWSSILIGTVAVAEEQEVLSSHLIAVLS